MTATALSAKDFASDQEVRWCPGCGDYAILKAVYKTLAEVGAVRERTVFISGIGCSSRFPYYMASYGFHTIHGRAPAIATGVKLANPELDVWIITGDGDGLSIGGNHTLHLLRRNLDVQLLLFNNEIYGLTKGQASPTSRKGTRSPSSPGGTIAQGLLPAPFALGAGARFVARAIDTQQAQLVDVLKRARAHRGASFVEIFQNCVVFNDDVFAEFTARDGAAETQLHVTHGEPLLFGADRNRGIRLRPGCLEIEVVTVGEGGVSERDVLVHDQTSLPLAMLLAGLRPPGFPMALGVLYENPEPSYDAALHAKIAAETAPPRGGLEEAMERGTTWKVG